MNIKSIKPLYFYLGGIVLIIVIYYFVVQGVNTPSAETSSVKKIDGMIVPQDNIHKGLENPVAQKPARDNVTAAIMKHMEDLKRDVEKHPGDTLKMREYADFLTEAHQKDQAVFYYEKVLKVNPRRVDILSSLVFLYFSGNDLNTAEKYLNKILSIDKNNLDAMYNLGVVSANKGDRLKAKQIWTKIVDEHPSSQMAQKAKESIAQL